MLQLIHGPVDKPVAGRPEIFLRVERLRLAKRLWRGRADDGAEFGFELAGPLRDGDTFWQTDATRYVIRQEPEPVLEVMLAVAPSVAAGIGWAVGNLHMELSADTQRLLAPDDPAVRQLFDRLKIDYRATVAVFRPGRFARGNAGTNEPAHDLGPGHRH